MEVREFMVNGIGSVLNIQQGYTQRSEPQEQEILDGISRVEASVTKGEEYNSSDNHEINQEKTQQAVDKLNKTMETYNTELRFQLHEKSGEYMVKLINTKDDSVVREIPPENILDMVAYFKEMVGLMVDKFA